MRSEALRYAEGGIFTARRYRLARKQKRITLTAAAKMLDVSQPTLSAWEGERKNPSVESMLQPIPPEALPAFHDTPVFSSRYGWAMVNAIEGELLFASGMRLSLADAAEVYVLPPAFATLGAAVSMPLRRDELTGYDCVWVEPISMDAALRDELRGWYHIKRRFVENEVGQRFYFDFYGAKWLAFANGPGNI